jgi:hypothetical protein
MDPDSEYRSGVGRAYRDHLIRTLGYKIPMVESAAGLIALATKASAAELEARHTFTTEPPFPGVCEEPEEMPTGWRMLCACRLFDGGIERGVIFTTFVSGRTVAIIVNVAGTVIPDHYKPLALR